MDIVTLAENAKTASKSLALLSTLQKNDALNKMAEALLENADYILKENKKDIENAQSKGISKVMIDRLSLSKERIEKIAEGVKIVSGLPDPIGRTEFANTLPNSLKVSKVTVPMGLIGIIYESRPNVTADISALCLKASSAVILRGGSDAINSNRAIASVLRKALNNAGLDENCISFVDDTSHETAEKMMKLNGILDLLIPRGGAKLIENVVKNSTVPVIQTGVGNCHIFVDESADEDMAVKIIINAKASRPSVCNACESLLLHKNLNNTFFKKLESEFEKNGIEVRGCEKTKEKMKISSLATEEDYAKEFLDYIISVKIVDSLDDAIEHIAKYSTSHSESIITNDYKNATRFTREVDSSAVYVNASTRFTDGFEFGLGAEIGISTQKLHARGPMGLSEITSYKYIIEGQGQVR